MGYKNSNWAKKQLRYLKGEGARAAKTLLMVMAEPANNNTRLWIGKETDLFVECDISKRSGVRGLRLLREAGLISREQNGNQHKATKYKLNLDTRLSESARIGIVKVPESTSESANSASESARIDTPIKEVTVLTGSNRKKESIKKEKPKPKRVTVIDEPFREKMRERFEEVLGDINDRIDEALGHKAASKYTDMQAYVTGWLRRDARNETSSLNGRPRTRSPDGIDYSPEKYEAMARKYNGAET